MSSCQNFTSTARTQVRRHRKFELMKGGVYACEKPYAVPEVKPMHQLNPSLKFGT